MVLGVGLIFALKEFTGYNRQNGIAQIGQGHFLLSYIAEGTGN